MAPLCDLWNFNFIYKVMLVWLFSVIFEITLCSSSHDIHRIILKTHHRRTRDRDVHQHKGHSSYQTRKPFVQEPLEGDWSSITTKTPHFHSNKNNRPYHQRNGSKRGNSRIITTIKPLSLIEMANIPERMSLPKFEETFSKYHNFKDNKNNSLDIYDGVESKLIQYNVSNAKGESHRRPNATETTTSNILKGYEVYEEIIGDINPPESPVAFFSGKFPIVIPKDEENHIKENVSDYIETMKNKTYTKRTKTRRGRGSSIKLE